MTNFDREDYNDAITEIVARTEELLKTMTKRVNDPKISKYTADILSYLNVNKQTSAGVIKLFLDEYSTKIKGRNSAFFEKKAKIKKHPVVTGILRKFIKSLPPGDKEEIFDELIIILEVCRIFGELKVKLI